MEPTLAAFIAGFLKIGEIADGVNDFYELIKNSAESKESLAGLLNRKASASDFENLFNRLEKGRSTAQSIHPGIDGDPTVYQAGIRLVFAIYFKYWQNPEFTQIPVLAGKPGEGAAFPMEHFFVDLSYVDKSELSRQDALLLREKESVQEKNVRGALFHNLVPHHLLTDEILGNYRRVAILGNPGVGKSTFARWLCYRWVRADRLLFPYIPVHINLRELRFGAQNCFTEYLQRKYLAPMRVEGEALEKAIVLQAHRFLLLLDGVDELSPAHKKQMWEALEDLSPELAYAIYARPYGLIDQSLQIDATLEVLGFNESTRNHYLSIRLEGDPKKTSTVWRVIDENPALRDISFNPLMLSYIVRIVENDSRPEQTLANIQSVYELQDLLLGWLQRYYETKGHEQPFRSTLDASCTFAYQLELEQLFLYDSRSTLDAWERIANWLAQLGLGNKEETQPGHWRFHFNTITFQEFLAARYVAPRITPNALQYLLNTQLHWNMARMVVGHLIAAGRSNVLDQVLQSLEYLFQKTGNRHYQHLHYYLLGEDSQQRLGMRYGQHDFIAAMLDDYIHTPTDSDWESLMVESIGRIYVKLPVTARTRFNQEYLKRLDEVMLKVYFRQPTYGRRILSDRLMPRLGLLQQPAFVKELLKLILQYLAHYQKIQHTLNTSESGEDQSVSELQHQSSAYSNRILALVRVVLEADAVFLQQHFRPELRHLAAGMPAEKDEELAQLVAVAYTPEEIMESVRELTIVVELGADNPNLDDRKNDEEQLYQAMAANLRTLGHALYTFACAASNPALLPNGQVAEIRSSIQVLLTAAHEEPYVWNAVEHWEFALSLTVRAMERLQPHFTVDEILRVMQDFNLDETIRFSDTAALERYVAGALQSIQKDGYSLNKVERLWSTLAYTDNSAHYLSRYRVALFESFRWVIETEIETLENAYEGKNLDLFMRTASQASNTLEWFVEMLRTDFDRQYMIDRIFESKLDQITFVAVDILPGLLKDGFAFYERRIWEYLQRLIEHKLVKKTLFILHDSGCFMYRSNLAPLKALWERIIPLVLEKPDSFAQYDGKVLFRSAYKTLLMCKQFGLASEVSDLPYLLDTLLRHPDLKANAAAGRWVDQEMLAYALLFHFTGLDSSKPEITFEETLTRTTYKSDLLLPGLYESFHLNELEHLRDLLGENLYQDANAFIAANRPVEAQFFKIVFERYLEDGSWWEDEA